MLLRTFASLVVIGLALQSSPLFAASYVVDCGASGSAARVQNQLDAIARTFGNSVTVTGTCVGDLQISDFDSLKLSGLALTGTVLINGSTNVTLSSLNLTGSLNLRDARHINVNNATINGDVTAVQSSQVVFATLTMNPLRDPFGTIRQGLMCLSMSRCTLDNATISGTSDSSSTGLLAASMSLIYLYSGTVTGFDVGVQVWNNSTALLLAMTCSGIRITGNKSIGVYATDAGIAKMEGLESASDCPDGARVQIDANGQYGVRADGGGNAYLYLTDIGRHSIDGIRVQNGSTAQVRSSAINIATTGRSAFVSGQAHLYFDEENNGPSARSTLTGPACLVNGATLDTSNSSTVVRTRCP